MAWVGRFRIWRGLVGWQWRNRQWLVWFNGGLGLMVGFVPLGLVSSLSRSSSDGGFDGGLGLCSFWWVVVLWQWKSGLCRLCSCCWVVVLWQWLWIVPFVVFFW